MVLYFFYFGNFEVKLIFNSRNPSLVFQTLIHGSLSLFFNYNAHLIWRRLEWWTCCLFNLF